MKTLWAAAAAITLLTPLPQAALAEPHSEPRSESHSLVLLLRTYSTATSADEECLHAGRTEAELPTWRLSCPSSVRVEAVANAPAGWSLVHEHMSAGSFVLNHYRLQSSVVSAAFPNAAPMELRLVW